MDKKTIKDLELAGKRVFIRVDFNVPIKDGEITDDTRIRGAMPTVKYAIEHGAKVILASHLGRPLKDKKKAEEKGMPYDAAKCSLKPIYEYLRAVPELQDVPTRGDEPVFMREQELTLGKAVVKNDRVFFAAICVGEAVMQQ